MMQAEHALGYRVAQRPRRRGLPHHIVGTGTRRRRLTLTVALAAAFATAGSLTGATAQGTAWPATLAFSRPEAVGGGVFVIERSGRVRVLSARGLAPSWSPDGRRLAYAAPAAGGVPDVYVSDADGKNRAWLTRTRRAAEATPRWAPDGRRLVVERGGRLFVIRADRRGEHFLANGREPTWSQKRSRIAFVSSRDGVDDLYVVGPSGHGLRRLTSSSAVESQPAWSPDGRKLAYVALEGEATDLYVLDVVRGTVVRLTQDLDGEAAPAWGLGGRTITFVSNRPGGPVWSIPAAGGALVPLGGPQWVDQPPGGRRFRSNARRSSTSGLPRTRLSSGPRPATTSSASPRPATTSASGPCRSWPRVRAVPRRPCAHPSGCGWSAAASARTRASECCDTRSLRPTNTGT